MKVILTEEIDKLGEIGDVVDVKPGYARNFLFPRKKAVEVTPHNIAVVETRRKKHIKKLELEKLSAIEQKAKIEELSLTIHKKAGENDVLFGSVTTSEIEEHFGKMGVTIERKKIHLSEPIKRIGNYSVKLKLFKDVEAEVKIEVLREEEPAEE